MLRRFRQVALTLIGERRIVMRIRKIRFQLDGLGERRHSGAPVARLAGRQTELVVRERISAVGINSFAGERNSLAGIVRNQRAPRGTDER